MDTIREILLPTILASWFFLLCPVILLVLFWNARLFRRKQRLVSPRVLYFPVVLLFGGLALLLIANGICGGVPGESPRSPGSADLAEAARTQLAAALGLALGGLGIFVPIMIGIWGELLEAKDSLLTSLDTRFSDRDEQNSELLQSSFVNVRAELDRFKTSSDQVAAKFYIAFLLGAFMLVGAGLWATVVLPDGWSQVYYRVSMVLAGLTVILIGFLLITFIIGLATMRPYDKTVEELRSRVSDMENRYKFLPRRSTERRTTDVSHKHID